eukprot:TRINITY_DN18171_c0_g1_i1.p1 TRINITY_DN18171_c0_g1~~TRINITY_DN18171_c0_g1_i1.p1  ORF type:complete len:103 (-),score=21.49 TRINITY_DN18171_c0_g1_i1:45-353(-)
MIRRPPRSTLSSSSAASDVYKRQLCARGSGAFRKPLKVWREPCWRYRKLSLIHISEPTRLLSISYAVFCLKKKKKKITRHTIKEQRINNYKKTKQVRNSIFI